MSFLSNSAQKSLLILQRNQVEYEKMLVMNAAARNTRQMTDYANSMQPEDPNETPPDLDNDWQYMQLQNIEQFLESRQDALDSQHQILDKQIEALTQVVNNNIKSGCTLNLLGG